jgi:hypothetical protein
VSHVFDGAKATAGSRTETAATSRPQASASLDLCIAGLRRMQLVATSALKLEWPWIPDSRASSEAAMVGACAD